MACPLIVEDFDYDYDDAVDLSFNLTECNCSITAHLANPLCSCPYDYDVDFTIPILTVLPLGSLYGLVFVLGTIGNTLVIFVVHNFKRMRNVTNTFLASLSMVDMCLLLFCIPVQYIKFISFVWTGGKWLCYAVHYVQGFTQICSVLTLTAMSIERYVAIVHPMKAVWLRSVGRARKMILYLWIIAFGLAVPNAYGMRFDERYASTLNITVYLCFRNGRENFQKTFGIYQLVVVLLIPLATMSFCYINVARVLCVTPRIRLRSGTNAAKPLQRLKSEPEMLRKNCQDKDAKTKKQIVRMLLAVVTLFTICWTPFIIDDVLTGFEVLCPESYTEQLKYFRMVCAIMAYLNSGINPIVYAFMSKNFRTTFKSAWNRCRNRKRHKKRHHYGIRAIGSRSISQLSFRPSSPLEVRIETPREERRWSNVSDDIRPHRLQVIDHRQPQSSLLSVSPTTSRRSSAASALSGSAGYTESMFLTVN